MRCNDWPHKCGIGNLAVLNPALHSRVEENAIIAANGQTENACMPIAFGALGLKGNGTETVMARGAKMKGNHAHAHGMWGK
jgi:hypothetical protein